MAGWAPKASDEARDPLALVLARDVQGAKRAYKEFRVVADFDEYLSVVAAGGHVYEVVPCGTSTPVWFFADHDCKADSADGLAPGEFEDMVTSAHLALFGLPPSEVGKSVFVSSSSRPDKLSVHVVVRCRATLAASRHIAAALHAGHVDPRARPDMSVYSSRLQQIRAVGSSKIGTAHVKTPTHPGCMSMHIVRIPPGDGPSSAPGVAPPFPLPAAPQRPPLLVEETAAAEGLMSSVVRAALRAATAFGDDFHADLCAVSSPSLRNTGRGAAVRAFVDGSSRTGARLVCPVSGTTHKSNRAVVEVPLDEGQRGGFFYTCLSYKCRIGAISVSTARPGA